MNIFNKIYHDKYKLLLIIPMLIVLVSLFQIYSQVQATGDFIQKGIALKGGYAVTVETTHDAKALEDLIKSQFPGEDIIVRIGTASGRQVSLIIEAPNTIEREILIDTIVQDIPGVIKEDIINNRGRNSVQTISAEFGSNFFAVAIKAIITAFIFMGIVVFLYFRVAIPSIAVILAAFSDIIVTLAVFNVLGLTLSEGGIAAFLMLIGYSVDTDILLSTRVLKHGTGTVYERVLSAMSTGMTMTITTIAAVTVGLIFANSELLRQVFTVLLIGLIIDIIMTWLQNAALLRWYMEKKHGKD